MKELCKEIELFLKSGKKHRDFVNGYKKYIAFKIADEADTNKTIRELIKKEIKRIMKKTRVYHILKVELLNHEPQDSFYQYYSVLRINIEGKRYFPFNIIDFIKAKIYE